MRDKDNCLETARNFRLCAGAIWYEERIAELEAQIEAVKECEHHTYIADNADEDYDFIYAAELNVALEPP